MKRLLLLFECLFNWRRYDSVNADYESAGAYVALDFGQRGDKPGRSNEFLANRLTYLYDIYPHIVISQNLVAEAAERDLRVDKIIFEHVVPGKYLDSYEVCRQAADYCKKINIKTVIVIAHPDQLWRVVKVLEKMGIKCLIGKTIRTPYDRRSTQIWTRSRRIFLPRELISRLLYFFTNKI